MRGTLQDMVRDKVISSVAKTHIAPVLRDVVDRHEGHIRAVGDLLERSGTLQGGTVSRAVHLISSVDGGAEVAAKYFVDLALYHLSGPTPVSNEVLDHNDPKEPEVASSSRSPFVDDLLA